MEVLTATAAQKKDLEGNYLNNSELKFVLDGNGRYIVGLGVLTDTDFESIWPQLEQLERIEYIPIIYKK